MIKRKHLSYLIPFFFHWNLYSHVPQDGKITATIGPFLYQTHYLDHPGLRNPFFLGGVVMAEGDINESGGLEVSIAYQQKIYATRENGLVNMEKAKRIHITTGYRHWWNEDFSTALSFFSSYAIGQGSVIRSDYPLHAAPPSSARDITEYGFELSLQRELWRMDRFTFLLDGRYAYSVTNKVNEDGNHYGLLLGLKYEIQERGALTKKRYSFSE